MYYTNVNLPCSPAPLLPFTPAPLQMMKSTLRLKFCRINRGVDLLGVQ
jgi:hypothetical protein